MPCRPCSFVNNVLKKEDDTLKYSVLGLGYAPNEYDVERTEWMKHGIVFDFATTANIYSHLDAVSKADTGAAMSKALG